MKGVDDALRRLEGVKRFRIDLQSNLVTIEPDPRVALPLAEVACAIRGAGFVPGEMRLRAAGKYEPGDRFRIRGWREAFRVKTSGPIREGEAEVRARVEFVDGETVIEPLP